MTTRERLLPGEQPGWATHKRVRKKLAAVRRPLRRCRRGGCCGARTHKNEPPVAARQAEVARDYLKRATRTNEFNGSTSGSDGPMATALKGYNGGRVLVFVMGALRPGADPRFVLQRRCQVHHRPVGARRVTVELIDPRYALEVVPRDLRLPCRPVACSPPPKG